MEDKVAKVQAGIDATFEKSNIAKPVHDRICQFAKRDIENPESLSLNEVKQVCFALVVHYAQMGIQ